MQKLCNLLTNFALCFDRAHKEKRCPFKTDSITLFREGGPWTNKAMSWAAVSFPAGLHSARWRLQGLGPADTTLTANRATFVHATLLFRSVPSTQIGQVHFFWFAEGFFFLLSHFGPKIRKTRRRQGRGKDMLATLLRLLHLDPDKDWMGRNGSDWEMTPASSRSSC